MIFNLYHLYKEPEYMVDLTETEFKNLPIGTYAYAVKVDNWVKSVCPAAINYNRRIISITADEVPKEILAFNMLAVAL